MAGSVERRDAAPAGERPRGDAVLRASVLRPLDHGRGPDARRQGPDLGTGAGGQDRQRAGAKGGPLVRRFEVGDRVSVREATTLFHHRTQAYIRGHVGVVVEQRPEWLIPEDEAWQREDGR